MTASPEPAAAIPEEIQQHFTLQQSSGLSIQAYCKEHSLSAGTFYTWRKRYGQTKRRLPRQQPCFSELGIFRLSEGVCELRFPTGVTMTVHHGAHREELAMVIDLLGGLQRC